MFYDAINIFGKMGLKPRDTRVLLTCMSNKNGHFIAELCEITKIKRSTLYLSLKRLMEAGYINKIRVGNRWKYYAENPENLVARQEMLLDNLKELEPLLKRLTNNKGQTEIRFYEGIDGIRKAYENVLISLKFAQNNKEKRDLLAFASGVHAQKVFVDWQKDFIDKRKRLGSWYKVIAPENSKSSPHFTNDKEQLRQARYIPKDQFPFKIMLEIYADSIFIYSPIKPVGGVIIKNGQIADSLRALFLFVWNNLAQEQ